MGEREPVLDAEVRGDPDGDCEVEGEAVADTDAVNAPERVGTAEPEGLPVREPLGDPDAETLPDDEPERVRSGERVGVTVPE